MHEALTPEGGLGYCLGMPKLIGFSDRDLAVKKAQEMSEVPWVSQIPDGSWIAIGDYSSPVGHALYGADGTRCDSLELGDAVTNYIGYAKRVYRI